MKLKACSLFLGYKEYDASIVQDTKAKYRLNVKSIGQVAPAEYVRNGFRVIQAKASELEALIAGGYESKRLRMRFYDVRTKTAWKS